MDDSATDFKLVDQEMRMMIIIIIIMIIIIIIIIIGTTGDALCLSEKCETGENSAKI